MREIYAVVDGERKWIQLQDRKCELCGKSFSPLRKGSKYCSRGCCKKAENFKNADKYRQRANRYYSENKKEISEKRKERYWKNPEQCRTKTREWAKTFRDKKRNMDLGYKDKTRHGNKRQELIDKYGLVCSRCDKKGDRYGIITHHVTFDSQDHSEQVLLCRRCHAIIHKPKGECILTRDALSSFV